MQCYSSDRPMTHFFTNTHQSKKIKSRARRGVLTTSHGQVQTPAFVPVATKGTIKSLTPPQIFDIPVQISFVNTYHLVTHPGSDIVQKGGYIHNYSGMQRTLMSDSGGFQVFSLAERSRRARVRGDEEPLLVSINESGVMFRSVYDGVLIEFTPEKSMQYQMEIGADINMAFDECTYHPATHEYAEKSMKRTHDWLTRCISYRSTHRHPEYQQYLYGIIQGSMYEDLRRQSAEFVTRQPIDGVAIGGVSVGETKQDMRDQVAWVRDFLPLDKPVHLLGVGHVDDIIDLVHHGIDTFDCVEPTRLARMGVLIEIQNLDKQITEWRSCETDITQNSYKSDTEHTIQHNLGGPGATYSYLHHLFKQKELLGYTYATIHNLIQMERLMARIREEIEADRL